MQQWEYLTMSAGVHLSAILKVTRWELEVEGKVYKSEQEVIAYLNQLGSEGWELVCTNPGSDSHGNITKLIFFFKRLKNPS